MLVEIFNTYLSAMSITANVHLEPVIKIYTLEISRDDRALCFLRICVYICFLLLISVAPKWHK